MGTAYALAGTATDFKEISDASQLIIRASYTGAVTGYAKGLPARKISVTTAIGVTRLIRSLPNTVSGENLG